MTPERWQAVRRVLDAALELPPEERAAFVERQCSDVGLRRDVEAMLVSYDEGETLLEKPIVRLGKTPEKSPEATPAHVGPYRLLEPIGEGGMGKVFRAHRDDDTYRKEVAVKILRQDQAGGELLQRFRSERQILANLEHPCIAKLLDGGTTQDGRPFLVMEYVRGLPIDTFCRRRRLTIDQRLTLVAKVCGAIQYAHQNLVVHRDLKPSNILVTEAGQPKLLDFGIAKILRPESFQQTVLPTRTGIMPMTPEYASPEQVRAAPVTTATDVYALGLLLYELLTGRRPYTIDAGSLESIVDAICRHEPPKPSTRVLAAAKSGDLRTGGPGATSHSAADPKTAEPDLAPIGEGRLLSRRLSGDLDAIVLRALRKEPSERYPSAAQLAEDLRRHLEGRPVEARRGTVLYRMTKFVRRHRLAVGLAAIALLVLVGFSARIWSQSQEISQQNDAIQLEFERAEHITDQLMDLFQLPAPNRARGEKVTARELLDKGAQSIGEVDDELEAELLSTIGHTYFQLGLLSEGEELLRQSIAATRRLATGSRLDDKARRRLERLCEHLTFQAEYRRAEVVCREVLAQLDLARASGQRVALGLPRARVAHLRDLLGDWQAAEALFEKALLEARRGDDPEALAKVLEYHGDERVRRGDFARARSIYEEALEILRVLHGDLHPEVTVIKASLARTLQVFDPQEAERLFLEAIATQRQLFDGPHPVLGTALNNLGSLLLDQGRTEEAEGYLKEAIVMQEELYGKDNPKLATSLSNLAQVELQLGSTPPAEARRLAEALYRRALATFEASLGEEHAEYALCLSNFADFLVGEGQLNEAKTLIDRAVRVIESSLDPRHPRMATVLNVRGQIEQRQGNLDAARQTLELAVEIADGTLGEHHPNLAAALVYLSLTFHALGDSEGAVEPMRRVVRLAETQDDLRDRKIEWLAWLARFELELESFVAAEGYARQAFEGWRQRAGSSSAWTLSSQSNLGRALLGQGRLDEADSVFRDLLAQAESLGAEGESRAASARELLAEIGRLRAESG
ncbi:MAG: serine/threonine-protein kinase [Acidobacteriota bacterium]